MGGVAGWLDTDNRAISVQLNLTGTATGTELGNMSLTSCEYEIFINYSSCFSCKNNVLENLSDVQSMTFFSILVAA